jgi:1-aminocyclopropane-1-carboxylate deaminase
MLSGNKFRKLKYNLEAARQGGWDRLMTFGGAFSNHIHATAAAGTLYGFDSIGFIRGAELADKPLNPTLSDARSQGMQLVFLSREEYRLRAESTFQKGLQNKYGPAFLLPEGGTNQLAIKGCAEILGPTDAQYSHICCPVGTGGTMAGLVLGAAHSMVWGYSALKAGELEVQLKTLMPGNNWQLRTHYHFGGYAKFDLELIEFIRAFKRHTGTILDPVYTGKMLFGVFADIQSGAIPSGSRVLAIHTGGLQGIRGMNQKLKKKGLPLLPL